MTTDSSDSGDSADTGPQGMRAVIDALCDGDPAEQLALRELVVDLGRSTFGVLLFVATLPAFIPIPGLAGALSGPLVVLVGLHLLILLRKPWLPNFIAKRGPQRSTLIRFDRISDRWLRWLERVVRPRLLGMIDHPVATVLTGLQLVLLGILLALPIPFTNFLFGGLLLLYALALLERDGVLMLISWVAGVIAIYIFGAVSGNLAAMLWAWVAGLG
ncbi:MAG: exopolysaccharide biosynthesis protein [Xanthomonadaceae bacterium]|nr:exopolysaccharide biosynthesis protein [Xanthomonadaceae bacterium]